MTTADFITSNTQKFSFLLLSMHTSASCVTSQVDGMSTPLSGCTTGSQYSWEYWKSSVCMDISLLLSCL